MKNFLQRAVVAVMLLISLQAYCQPNKLNSLLSAQSAIFLDFDGQTVQTGAWQSGVPFICAPSALSSDQITEIFNRVSEDYRPFAVNITTDSTVYFAAPPAQRVRIIITTTSAWYPNVGGVTYIGSFTWGDETPGFVFADKLLFNTKNIAECCTHESGHAVGLSHQARYDTNCNLLEQYNTGNGTGETSWAPVMGASYYRNMTGWSDGPTPYDCTLVQDNLTIITTENGFNYRDDDFPETMDASTKSLDPAAFTVQGIITTPTDKDAFKLVIPQSGPYYFQASPYSFGPNDDGADLDIMMSLFNSAGVLIESFNPLATMSLSVDTTLSAGTYYVQIAGAGNNNTSNYGSLGSYTFSGYKGLLPIHSVSLFGSSSKNTHQLSWNIIADEQIAKQVLQVSSDGVNFAELTTTDGNARSYSYSPVKSGTWYYSVKATSVLGQSLLSNIVVLKSGNDVKQFIVSTLVIQNISVTAEVNYSYALYDINGRMLKENKAAAGTTMINVQDLPQGMYILQMLSNDYKQTERIIKQ